MFLLRIRKDPLNAGFTTERATAPFEDDIDDGHSKQQDWWIMKERVEKFAAKRESSS